MKAHHKKRKISLSLDKSKKNNFENADSVEESIFIVNLNLLRIFFFKVMDPKEKKSNENCIVY